MVSVKATKELAGLSDMNQKIIPLCPPVQSVCLKEVTVCSISNQALTQQKEREMELGVCNKENALSCLLYYTEP